ncbi:GP88 family protein [Romboutsia sp.]|uniref:GP88 family protein n=1 Tax=Romboutsia sp. TaxID=1965302 RepID=UPI002BA0F736|nr:hypothetical protein [Romboutsia sp.]HSQ89840.1 hypothetical protein [Romboutsia sp.]
MTIITQKQYVETQLNTIFDMQLEGKMSWLNWSSRNGSLHYVIDNNAYYEDVMPVEPMKMDLQLLASSKKENTEKKLTDKEITKSMQDAQNAGFEVVNACQAHIVNNITSIFNDKFYMKENNKTDRIPVFNLPNIKVQKDFLQIIKNNPEIMDFIPEKEKEKFEDFIEYMKNNKMCVNCSTCKESCYNNKAYTQYPYKAVCDLRQLYRVINKPHVVAGEIVQETINSKNARLNGSGEIHNEKILDLYKRVAKSNPDTKYYTYTKNYKLLEGKKLPKNLVVNISDFGTSEQIKESIELLPNNLNTFKAVTPAEMLEIKQDKEKSKTICHGESCSSCRLCTVKKSLTIYCEIH